jgi:hypothetical protein
LLLVAVVGCWWRFGGTRFFTVEGVSRAVGVGGGAEVEVPEVALEADVCQHPTIAPVTGGLAVAWNTALIDSFSQGVPQALNEAVMPGRTLKKRAADVLAYFDRPGTSTERQRRSTAASSTCASPPSGTPLRAATLGTSYARAIRPRSTSGKPGSSPSA